MFYFSIPSNRMKTPRRDVIALLVLIAADANDAKEKLRDNVLMKSMSGIIYNNCGEYRQGLSYRVYI